MTMNIFENKLFVTGVKYSTVSTVKSLIAMIAGFVIMFWLSPLEVGKWNTVSIFLAYAPFLQLGIQSGLSIELPVLLGKQEDDRAKAHIANSFGFAILISIVILLLGAVMTGIFYYKYGCDLTLGIVAITLLAICSSFQTHFIARFRSSRAFDNLTKIILLEIPFDIIFIWFIYKWHYYGLLLYNVGIGVIPIVLMYMYMPYKDVRPQINAREMLSLGKVGVALMAQNQLQKAAQTLPRWVILMRTTVEKLGLFTPAMAVNNLISLVPGQIAQFFHPQMGYIYGKTGTAKSMWPYVWKMNLALPLFTMPIAGGIWIMAPWVLDTFFPKYIESLWAMRIMSVAFVFSSSITTSWVLNTIHAFKYAYVFSISNFIGSFIFPYLMTILLDKDILTSVTIGLTINNIVCYIINFCILRIVLFMPVYNKIKAD